MMISIDEFTEIMDDIAHELPDEFYRDLNGGILILPGQEAQPLCKGCGSVGARDLCAQLVDWQADRDILRFVL